MSTKPRTAGRPTVLTDEVQERIVTAIKAGSYLDDAANYAGISYRTVLRWVERGRIADSNLADGNDITDDERPFWQFWQSVENARAQAVVRNVGIIQSAAQNGQWQAAAWYLERTNPRKWGRHETVEITGADGGAIQVEHSVKDTLAAKFAAAEKAAIQVIETREADTPQAELRRAQ